MRGRKRSILVEIGGSSEQTGLAMPNPLLTSGADELIDPPCSLTLEEIKIVEAAATAH